jgi:hypothetical protein
MSVEWSGGYGRCEYPWWLFGGGGMVLGGVGLGGEVMGVGCEHVEVCA